MIFPERFSKRLKAEWPASEELNEALDSGDPEIVLDYIGKERCVFPDIMDPIDIIAALDKGELDKIRRAAEKAIRLGELLDEFLDLCQAQGVELD